MSLKDVLFYKCIIHILIVLEVTFDSNDVMVQGFVKKRNPTAEVQNKPSSSSEDVNPSLESSYPRNHNSSS